MTSDLNDRIAKAKGWRYMIHDVQMGIVVSSPHPELSPEHPGLAIWYDSQNRRSDRLDFTGTVEGLAGMMRELGGHWVWGWSGRGFVCSRGENCSSDEYFCSPPDRPGDCVGEAWLSVFEKEAG